MTIPVREVDGLESLALGFRVEHVTCEHGGLYSGAGCGSPWIEIRWKERTFCIHAIELLAAVVATFDPEDAKRIDGGTSSGTIEVSAGTGG